MNEELRKKIEENNNRKVFNKYKSTDGINILRVYDNAEIEENHKAIFEKMISINCEPSFTQDRGQSAFRYFELLYENIGVKPTKLKWLIPSFGGGTQWYEIEITDLYLFSTNYFENESFLDFSAIDLENRVAFEIEFAEDNYEFYIESF